MKTGLIVVGSIMVCLSAISHFCIFMVNQQRELEGESFVMEYTMSSWLLPLSGVICIVFGIFL